MKGDLHFQTHTQLTNVNNASHRRLYKSKSEKSSPTNMYVNSTWDLGMCYKQNIQAVVLTFELNETSEYFRYGANNWLLGIV